MSRETVNVNVRITPTLKKIIEKYIECLQQVPNLRLFYGSVRSANKLALIL